MTVDIEQTDAERAEIERIAAYLYRDEHKWAFEADWRVLPLDVRERYLRRARTVADMLGWPHTGRTLRHLDRLCPCDPNPETTDGPQRDCPIHGEQPDAVDAIADALRTLPVVEAELTETRTALRVARETLAALREQGVQIPTLPQREATVHPLHAVTEPPR